MRFMTIMFPKDYENARVPTSKAWSRLPAARTSRCANSQIAI